jgi:hypothetical protein
LRRLQIHAIPFANGVFRTFAGQRPHSAISSRPRFLCWWPANLLIAMDENKLRTHFGLVPVVADLPEIRRLIEAAIADNVRESNEPLKLLCIQLFPAGIPSDARSSSTKPRCHLSMRDVT